MTPHPHPNPMKMTRTRNRAQSMPYIRASQTMLQQLGALFQDRFSLHRSAVTWDGFWQDKPLAINTNVWLGRDTLEYKYGQQWSPKETAREIRKYTILHPYPTRRCYNLIHLGWSWALGMLKDLQAIWICKQVRDLFIHKNLRYLWHWCFYRSIICFNM